MPALRELLHLQWQRRRLLDLLALRRLPVDLSRGCLRGRLLPSLGWPKARLVEPGAAGRIVMGNFSFHGERLRLKLLTSSRQYALAYERVDIPEHEGQLRVHFPNSAEFQVEYSELGGTPS